MGLEISGGTGNGYAAKVNSQHQLATAATTVTKEHEINHADGQAYSVFASLTPTLVNAGAATGCFMYIKNTGETDMIVAEMMMWAASSEMFMIKLGDEGTPLGGAATTPSNRNAGKGNQADVTALTSVEITGLSGGNMVFGFTKGATDSIRIAPATGFIVPKNNVLTVYVGTGNVAIRFGMGITFHNQEI